MARPIRDPRIRRERPGQKPLLQGHLRPGGAASQDAPHGTPGDTSGQPVPEPASEVPATAADVTRGKATRSPAEVAKRRNLEGSEQGPV